MNLLPVLFLVLYFFVFIALIGALIALGSEHRGPQG
jgi:hypothetical protein